LLKLLREAKGRRTSDEGATPRYRLQEKVLSATAFGLVLLIFIAAFPALFQFKGSRKAPCLSNVKQQVLGMAMYADDNDHVLPAIDLWMDKIHRYTKSDEPFHDFDGVGPGEYGYAFRDSAGGLKVSNQPQPATFAIIFDSTLLTRNAHGETSTMPRPGRHSGLDTVGFLEGHAKAIRMR